MSNFNLPKAWDEVGEELNAIPLIAERIRYAVTIKPLLDLPKAAHILEVGTGAGRLLRLLHALGYDHLTGLEISGERLLEVSRRGPSSAKLVCSDTIPFAANSFDAIASAAVIEHVVDPEYWLSEIARIVRPNGLVSVATDTYMWHWLKRLGIYTSIQPIDDAILPALLIQWANKINLNLIGCGGFINTPDQKFYFPKQLLLYPGKRVIGKIRKLTQSRLPLKNHKVDAADASETALLLEAIQLLPQYSYPGLTHCIWSYECYYWFQKG